jgi:hypothetical protein
VRGMLAKVETFEIILKGVDLPFKLKGDSRIIGTVIINCSVGRIFYSFLKGHHPKASIKLFSPLYKFGN